jgi:peroxiredoxin
VSVTRVAGQKKLEREIAALRAQAAAQVKNAQFVQAADTFERLQVLFMDAGRYQDALESARAIESVSAKLPGRRSPRNFVRIAEAHLAMGDVDRYFEWMERAVGERYFSKADYFQGADLDAVRKDPRFTRLAAASAALTGVGEPASDFEVTLLDGSTFVLSSQRGKVVLVDFWDVGCVPCRREMPNLKSIYRNFKDRGLEILGISLDTDRKVLSDYVRETALPWKIACSFEGWNDRTATLYRISATPSTWLIDRRGIVRYYDVRSEELRRAVEVLVNEL